ncbi:MAG: glycoside hydrolase domain-containing protein [Bryobacteraceae bacterium]
MRRTNFPVFFWALTILLALLSGCSGGSGIEYWFVDSLTKVFPDDPVGKGRLEKAAFSCARNSNVSIQLALRSNQAVGDLFVDALPLRGPGAPIEKTRVRWVEYVVVTSNTQDTPDGELLRKAPALFPDALLTDFPITVRKNQTRSIWVTIHVPKSQEPGEYEGQLRLRQGTGTLVTVPYTLIVRKATVPERIPLAVTNHFGFGDRQVEQFFSCTRYSSSWWRLIANHAHFLAGYYQNSIGTNPIAQTSAEVAGGALRYDFSNFERFVETFEAAGVRGYIEGGNLLSRERRRDAPIMTQAWVIEGGKPVLQSLPYDDPRAQRFLDSFLPALYARLQERGWTTKYLQGILDEPNQWEVKAFLDAAAKVRRLMPGVRTIEPVGLKQDVTFMKKTVDIWVPQLGTFDAKMDLLRKHVTEDGGELWFYTCLAPRGAYPNRFIDTSLTKVRLLHWINYKWDFRGFLHWGGNHWGPDPIKDTQPVINEGRTYLPPGDAYITYPNRAGRSLYSSIRLEQMREGIEDFGLLTELDKKDHALAQRIANEAVRTFVDYVREPREFRAIHERLLAAF